MTLLAQVLQRVKIIHNQAIGHQICYLKRRCVFGPDAPAPFSPSRQAEVKVRASPLQNLKLKLNAWSIPGSNMEASS